MRKAISIILALAAMPAGTATASTSHEGWPKIDGMLLMNKTDAPRPLDARPGHDPFGGNRSRAIVRRVHKRGACHRRMVRTSAGVVVTSKAGHNELLGGHGNDALYAGPWGDVLWADYKPSGQPTTQVDQVFGGNGKDFIYASHGTNTISAAAGTTGSRRTSAAGPSTAAADGTCCTSAAGRSATTRSTRASGSRTRRSAADPKRESPASAGLS